MACVKKEEDEKKWREAVVEDLKSLDLKIWEARMFSFVGMGILFLLVIAAMIKASRG